ncbi:helix-turn-helix domain-containing protein [Microbacterium sp. CFBP9023]|uniref:helix-turn-helix domain-containing protein n=1 Tax=Microbacterium TaxID=33882 RepID=UPI001E534B48|nr:MULTISPECIES: helix-turn-helix domain-containing protein [unclassified Microbacterium]MDY0984472.1 helix-turn-helix domain-containing protein [Microbacterium sp. CFBP9023]
MKTPGEQFNAAVGRQLRAEIAAAGSSIAAMAREVGIARSALDNYVTGKRSIPVPILYAVSAALDIAPHVVITRAEERLRSEGFRGGATITALHPRTDVRGRRQDESEVAFESPLAHADDTDDLYD